MSSNNWRNGRVDDQLPKWLRLFMPFERVTEDPLLARHLWDRTDDKYGIRFYAKRWPLPKLSRDRLPSWF